VHQAETLLRFAQSVNNPQLAAALVEKASNLKSQVDDQPRRQTVAPRLPTSSVPPHDCLTQATSTTMPIQTESICTERRRSSRSSEPKKRLTQPQDRIGKNWQLSGTRWRVSQLGSEAKTCRPCRTRVRLSEPAVAARGFARYEAWTWTAYRRPTYS
jgi:hypothetical protein